MDLDNESRQHLKVFANETLEQFEKIATVAKNNINDGRRSSADAFATMNTMTSGATVRSLDKIDQEKRDSYRILAAEPAIARVVTADEEGKERVYYICRTTPPTGFYNLASYRAPVGRLASLSVGSEFKLPFSMTKITIIERAQLRPSALPEGWDSRNTVIEAEHLGPVTIESLRALLYEITGEAPTEDLLSQLLAEDTDKVNIIEGVRRSIITKMGLRDQPVLDQYQDEIFRLPLGKRLLILGPPGTGKTTTLIRRLGQKLDTAYLDEEEQRLTESASATHGLAHVNSWLMFTPTELLKQYLKEAFAREDIPASDLQIKTWQDYRRELSRNTLGVLKTASGGGTFVLKDTLQSLSVDAVDRSIQWYSDFDYWQRAVFLTDLREAAKLLSNEQASEVQSIGKLLAETLDRSDESSVAVTIAKLVVYIPKVQALVSAMKETSDESIKRALNLQLNRNRAFLDELAAYIDELQQQTQSIDMDDQDEVDVDEEGEAAIPRTGRAAALSAYMQAVRAQARSAASQRTLNKSSRNGKLIAWLGDRTLAETVRKELGASLVVQSNSRRFINPIKRYIDGFPKRYRSFRRLRQEEGAWYVKDKIENRDIHPLELDGVLLAILRAAGELMSVADVDGPGGAPLKPILDLYRNQILVDEATDFSPIQLACMASMAHPRIRSFFACGDFNQRLTTWGTRSAEDIKWVFPDFDIKEVTISYRQSRQLNEIARAIVLAVGGTHQSVTLPVRVDNEGVAAALLEGVVEIQDVVSWLGARVREIERFVGQLPSTAIFVNSEDEVVPIAVALNAALAEQNIQVVACPQGQVMGQDNDVRVFDIQYIKGLEFEAVFFIAVDRLAVLHPTLFDKYLYVGTTRAATYLGVTCEVALPAVIDGLRPHFAQNWQSPGFNTL